MNVSPGILSMPYYGREKLLVGEHNTEDIIDAIAMKHDKSAKDYNTDAEMFWRGNAEKTAKYLFNFLKKNVDYDIEPERRQTVKSPGAIIAEGKGDCKHYASFINGVAQALKRKGYDIDSYYMFVADSPGREVHHVFAVVTEPSSGAEYWDDPVLNFFNERPRFFNAKKLNMPVYEISGTEYGPGRNMPMVAGGYGIGKKKGGFFHNLAHGLAVDAQNTAKGAQQTLKKVESVVLEVAGELARNAVLALTDINAFDLARRMAAGNLNGLFAKWHSIGGDPGKLKNAINNGLKHAHNSQHIAGVGDTTPTSSGPQTHTNALAALANTLIGMLESYFGLPKTPIFNATQQLQAAAQAGTQSFIQTAAGMPPAHGNGLGPGSTANLTGSLSANGTPTVSVTSATSPVLSAAGGDNGGAGAALAAMPPTPDMSAQTPNFPNGPTSSAPDQSPAPTPDTTPQPPAAMLQAASPADQGVKPEKEGIIQEVEDFAKKNKKPLLIGAGLILFWKLAVGKKSPLHLIK